MTPKRLKVLELDHWYATRNWSACFKRRAPAGLVIAERIEQQIGAHFGDSVDLRCLLAVTERQHIAKYVNISCNNIRNSLEYQLGAASLEFLETSAPISMGRDYFSIQSKL